jgi:D-cysteine desulfhydrase
VSAAALLARFPALVDRLPHERLVGVPTPVEHVAGLGAWVKRDDLTAAPYGGNKVRKLELLLAEARRRGHRSVLTLGGTGSNHVLATAVYARALGFQATHAVLFPQPESEEVTRRLGVLGELGVAVSRVPGKALVPAGFVGRAFASLLRGQGAPFVIGPGGSSPLGALGYAGAALELAAQVEAGECPEPASVYVPLGSGGTAAGLLLGLRLAGLRSRLVAVQVVERPWASGAQAARLATRAARLLVSLGVPEAHLRFGPGDLVVVTDQLGPGYGASTPAATDAAARAAAEGGLVLDTTYAGKTLAALLARGGAGGPSLFWLTYAAGVSDPERMISAMLAGCGRSLPGSAASTSTRSSCPSSGCSIRRCATGPSSSGAGRAGAAW